MVKRYSVRAKSLVRRNKHRYNSVFQNNNVKFIDYKDIEFLKKFINRQGEIIPGIFNILTVKYQKKISKAIKRAREMALIPYNIIEQKDIANMQQQQRRNF
ncbi:MAG TPA: 30S ribosomal protein S18 [Mycoplasmatales bacterium]|jgi:small subunit ribosomal protein S18|nr:30S ribosomal protein S18 [Mycoplasmatales bacterium]